MGHDLKRSTSDRSPQQAMNEGDAYEAMNEGDGDDDGRLWPSDDDDDDDDDGDGDDDDDDDANE